MKKIGIFINNFEKNWGPGKLTHNTIKGFDSFNIPYVINEYGDFNFCMCGDKFSKFFNNRQIPNTIIGPCSLFGPKQTFDDGSSAIDSFKYYDFIVASEWVVKEWERHGVRNINHWFGGVDTEHFIDEKCNAEECFIYFKHRSISELHMVTSILEEMHIKYNILSYGSYSESELIDINNRSKFGIILSNTETQGFAIMECLSMNTPLLVLDKNTMEFWGNDFEFATSVPYFSEKCGIVIPEKIKEREYIKEKILLISNTESYSPRSFILDGYKISDSIEMLLGIFKEKLDYQF